MKKERFVNTLKSVGLGFLIAFVLLAGVQSHFAPSARGQGSSSLPVTNPNAKLPLMTFTATSQTVKQITGGFSTATVDIEGTALTTVTWQLKCSNNSGTTFYGIPSLAANGTVTSGVLPIVTAGAITTTSAGLYYFNLAGCTNVEIVTSGTFTATSVTAQITASSNKGLI